MVNECACSISAQVPGRDFKCVVRSGGRPCTQDRQGCTGVGGVKRIPYRCSLPQAVTCTWWNTGKTCGAGATWHRYPTSHSCALWHAVMTCSPFNSHSQSGSTAKPAQSSRSCEEPPDRSAPDEVKRCACKCARLVASSCGSYCQVLLASERRSSCAC